MTPLVSVIIPAYNRAKMLEEALRSVTNQTYKHLEIIVIDDASTDRTMEVVQQLAKQDSRIVYFKQPENKGSIAAKNKGIEMVTGAYISFLDSDDTILRDKIELLVEAISLKEKAIAVFGGWQWCNFKTGKVRLERIPDRKGKIEGLPRWTYNILPDLVASGFMKEHLYHPEIKSYEQYDILVKIFKTGKVTFVSKVLSRFRDHDGPRSSQNYSSRIKAIDNLFKHHKSFIQKEKKFCSRMQLVRALYLAKMSEPKRAVRKVLRHALSWNPFNWKAYYHYFKTFR